MEKKHRLEHSLATIGQRKAVVFQPDRQRWTLAGRFIFYLFTIVFPLSLWLTACEREEQATPVPLAEEIVFYGWAGDQMQAIFADFAQEYGVKVRYEMYESQEEALENIKNDQVYDIVDLDNSLIPKAIGAGLLAEINYSNVPNFKNVSLNFRDLSHDPDNKHTIPYAWGSTGLIVRTDLAERPIERWADLWAPDYAGRVAMWRSTPRYTLGIALKSLGYSVNSEEPAELEQALAYLLELQPAAIWLGEDLASSAPWLINGQAVMAMGWALDHELARAESDSIAYVLPQEGAILWGETLVIPSNTPNKYTAELFLNFLLRPEMTAKVVNAAGYAIPNEAAKPFISSELLNNPAAYPPDEALKNAEILLPLNAEGQALHEAIWSRFLEQFN